MQKLAIQFTLAKLLHQKNLHPKEAEVKDFTQECTQGLNYVKSLQ